MKLEMGHFFSFFWMVTSAGFTQDYANASVLQTQSGTSESPETSAVPTRGTIKRDPTEAPPPLQPSTTTTTTKTTTIRTALPFEKLTNDLIQANNVSIEDARLNLARYQTQLNLNALDMLLPKLRQLRQNMTNLLASPPPDHYAFETQSTALDEKLTEVELQISKNRNLLQRYKNMERDTQKQLGEIYESLGLLLYSQVRILSDAPVPIIPSGSSTKTEGEMSAFLNITFFNYLDSADGGSNIQEYLKMLEDSGNRIFAYNMTLQLIKLHGARFDTLLVQLGKNIFKFPELAPLKSLVPENVQMIFTAEAKLIQARTSARKLIIDSDEGISLGHSEWTPARIWKFYCLKNSEYFAIVDAVRHKYLGFVQLGSNTLLNLPCFVSYANEDSIKDNYFFQWKILISGRNSPFYYIKFINRQTGLALDISTDDNVVGQLAGDAYSQDWEFH